MVIYFPQYLIKDTCELGTVGIYLQYICISNVYNIFDFKVIYTCRPDGSGVWFILILPVNVMSVNIHMPLHYKWINYYYYDYDYDEVIIDLSANACRTVTLYRHYCFAWQYALFPDIACLGWCFCKFLKCRWTFSMSNFLCNPHTSHPWFKILQTQDSRRENKAQWFKYDGFIVDLKANNAYDLGILTAFAFLKIYL